MRQSGKTLTIASLALLSLLIVSVRPADAASITFNDGFEGSSFNPFWTLTQQFGTISLSTAQAHSGTQSAAFTSSSGGQREVHLTHTFASLLNGDASIWYYDAAPNQQTLYEQFTLTNSVSGSTYTLGTMDFDASCYEASVAGLGPSANCGSFPQPTTTNVARTLGWHFLRINATSSGIALTIDNAQVYSAAGNYSFDGIDIVLNGPGFRPNTTAYWDDFSLSADPVGTVPEPTSLLLLGTGAAAAAWRRRRRP